MKKPGFMRGLEQRTYVTHELHRYLPDDAWRPQGPNIGLHGENLTIAFLSLERPDLSLRLVRSLAEHIPRFAGELLVVDNGSTAGTRNVLRDGFAGMPSRWRLVELHKNHGVAGGRNRGTQHVSTDWVMWLDNDIYFIGNPLPRIHADLAQLGCHFMSLPLLQPDQKVLFAKGGHLYLESKRDGLYLGAGSAVEQAAIEERDGPGFMSTFLFGGACVSKVRSFIAMGGYDEQAFVGFEDIDFSLRLFRSGMKVGVTGAVMLVHDHAKSEAPLDREYEAQRFHSEMLRKSAQHFEDKHGFRFWSDDTTKWINARRAALGMESEEPKKQPASEAGLGRPKIALVIDIDGWAFFNIASQLVRILSDRFDITIVSMRSVAQNIVKILLMCEDRDLIHVFWRDDLSQLNRSRSRRHAASLGYGYEDFLNRHLHSKAITTSVFDHLFLEPRMVEAKRNAFEKVATAYAVCSQRLDRIYREIPGYPPPAAVLQDGVDLRLFQPMRLERLNQRPDDPLVVGWAGNSRWRQQVEDYKGVDTILRPTLDALAAEGRPIRWRFADRNDRVESPIPFSEMPGYYASIDVLVCCSKVEGTPNPVLEAMACGVPVISTDVGVVPEVFGPRQREFILPERSGAALRNALLRLLDNRALLLNLSQENLASIRSWDWSLQAQKYGDFFAEALAKFPTKQG